MDSKQSKMLIEKLLRDFDPSKQKANQEYLELQIQNLNRMILTYRRRSQDPENSARHRAICRDLEQNALGLANGIKFAISFLNCDGVDLMSGDLEASAGGD